MSQSETAVSAVSAVLIAIGTELSTGQVINSNSAWIGARLTDAGCENLLHWTLPDDRPLIHEALASAAARSRLVILTGGLGPTSDDFTREVVAEWLGQPLEFHAPSWERIEARAAAYGFSLGASQKQQCWFPAGAEVFANPAGTADAFGVFRDDLSLIVLPGPPQEIRALWESAVAERLRPLMPARPPVTLFRWHCMGVGEGHLGEIVEAALAGEQGLVTGYRAHAPYIEVKLWVPTDRDPSPILANLEDAIGPWVVLREDEDAARRLLAGLQPTTPLRIHDAVTGGLLAARLQQALREHPGRTAPLSLETRWLGPVGQGDPRDAMLWLSESEAGADGLLLAIGGLGGPDGRQWSLGLRNAGQLRFELFELPFAGPPGRGLPYVCEMAIMTAWEWLHESSQTID